MSHVAFHLSCLLVDFTIYAPDADKTPLKIAQLARSWFVYLDYSEVERVFGVVSAYKRKHKLCTPLYIDTVNEIVDTLSIPENLESLR